MPVLDGHGTLHLLSKNPDTAGIPFIFLTAKSERSDIRKGMEMGADDYLTKPFNLEELLLRVHNLLKRNTYQFSILQDELYKFGENEINFITFEIKGVNKKKIEITKREIALLKLLIKRCGQVISREEILDEIWGAEAFTSSRTIDNYILSFRKYFEKMPKEPKHFHSIRGVGYKFTN